MAFKEETLETIKQKDVPHVEEKESKVNDESKKEEEKESEDEEVEGSSKRGRTESVKNGKRGSKKVKIDLSLKEAVTPIERPTRERKTVERYAELAVRGSASKPFSIEQGPGTQLKEIPNVAYKLSKRKPDDNLQTLHNILFGKRAKVNWLKRNIGMFSGYVWADDEQEKQRAKMKEKLDKCVKEKLLDFCDILNIQIHKSSLKKEEVSSKLLEFLESPHATTEVLLADKEQKSKKRKAKARRSKTSSKKQSGKRRKLSSKTEEEDKVSDVEASESEDDSQDDDDNDTPPKADSDEENNKSEEEGEEEEEEEINPKKQPNGKSSPKKSVKKDSRGKKPSRSASKKVTDSDGGVGKGENKKKVKSEPTNEEMHAVVAKMLKEVDFNTATLSDILKQLGTHFEMDLMHRKPGVKAIVAEVINNMSDEEDKEEEEESAADGDDDAEDNNDS